MTTFHPFPRLPSELRLRVWDLAAEPRVVEIFSTRRYKYEEGSMMIEELFHSPAPVPLLLHTCSEARRHPSYRQAFDNRHYNGLKMDKDEPQCYTWINFEVDTIQCSESIIWKSSVERPLIRRLRMEVYDYDGFESEGTPIFKKLTALESLDILYGDDMKDWVDMYDWDYGVCPNKNLRLVSTTTGEIWDERQCREVGKRILEGMTSTGSS